MAEPQDKTASPSKAPRRDSDERPKDAEGNPEFLSEDSECEDEVELSSEDSFPASDPPSYTPVRTGSPKQPRGTHKTK